jgi:copper(I)-binding protein
MNGLGWRRGLLGLALLPAWVQASDAPAVAFDQAWIRAVPPGTPVMAGYVEIVNRGNTEATIRAIESSAFGAVELHEMREVDGVMRMRPLPELRLEPERTVSLAPGGLHLMLFRPTQDLGAGQRASIEFVLGDGQRRVVEFEVRAAD